MEEGTILYLCTVAPLLYLLSDLLPPAPFPMYSIYRQCVTVGWGVGGVLKCTVDHILQESEPTKLLHTPNKKVKTTLGLVSLKFLRPWSASLQYGSTVHGLNSC